MFALVAKGALEMRQGEGGSADHGEAGRDGDVEGGNSRSLRKYEEAAEKVVKMLQRMKLTSSEDEVDGGREDDR